MYTRTIAAFTLLTLAGVANAQSRFESTPQHRTCMSYASSMAEQRRCDSEEIERQKALVNAEYSIVTSDVPAQVRAKLEQAQKAWVSFRDLDCASKSAAVSGSGGVDAYNSCMLQHVKLRKLQLEAYFSL